MKNWFKKTVFSNPNFVYFAIWFILSFLVIFSRSDLIDKLFSKTICQIINPIGDKSFYQGRTQNLITVLVGISALVFPLAIFTMESSNLSSSTNETRVLLNESNLLIIILSIVSTFIILIFGNANFFMQILVSYIGFYTTISIINVIGILTKRDIFLKKIADMLNEKISEVFEEEKDLETKKIIENRNRRIKRYEFGKERSNIKRIFGREYLFAHRELIVFAKTYKRKYFRKRYPEYNRRCKDLEEGILELNNQYKQYIKDKQADGIKQFNDIYILFFETLVGKIQKHQLNKSRGRFSKKWRAFYKAKSFEDWKVSKWIEPSLNDFLKVSSETKDIAIVVNVFQLNIDAAVLSIRYKNNIIFKEFLEFYKTLYFNLLSDNNSNKNKNIIMKNCVENISEVDKVLYSEYSSCSNYKDKKYLDSFIDILINLFYELLKTSFEKEDKECFSVFLSKIISLFSWTDEDKFSGILQNNIISQEIALKKQKMFFILYPHLLQVCFKELFERSLVEIYNGTIDLAMGKDVVKFAQNFIYFSHEKNENKFFNENCLFFVLNSLSIFEKADQKNQKIKEEYVKELAQLTKNEREELNRVINSVNENSYKDSYILPKKGEKNTIDLIKSIYGNIF